jgi:molybdate transport system substrate-binding protein
MMAPLACFHAERSFYAIERLQLRVALIALAVLSVSAAPSPGDEFVVAAAASLRNPMQQLAEAFEAQHPEIKVRLSFGASSSLARQIRLGAPIDVFVSADNRWVLDLLQRDLIAPDDHFPLAGNRLVIIARTALDIRIESGRDLLNPRIQSIALPSAAVPLGGYARQWLDTVQVLDALEARFVTTEHARASVVAVEHHHADAALVYASDAQYAPQSKIVYRIPASEQPKIVYSVALLRSARALTGAKAFYRMLSSPRAADIFASAGFVSLDPQAVESSP